MNNFKEVLIKILLLLIAPGFAITVTQVSTGSYTSSLIVGVIVLIGTFWILFIQENKDQ
ncbi:hypothetical protein NC796_06455 [Aliifodinibius sp. S!AR15-10]|uniref:hypothetical protein n=1 Tax=Aliifodinibius sp. S!AR15-10 TaxID=2950437 RepID=UPI002867965F|nr:hypothetical protein [Aliifodinibius sp. S!AR15-10]MDR8390769.1 hypothetical protein [Aliifodinibius sp. S!AR15-10]